MSPGTPIVVSKKKKKLGLNYSFKTKFGANARSSPRSWCGLMQMATCDENICVHALSSYLRQTKLLMNGTQDIFFGFSSFFFFMLPQMSSISALCSRWNVLEARIDSTNRTIIQYAVKWSYALKHSRSILVLSGPPVARETSQVCVCVCICVSMSACIGTCIACNWQHLCESVPFNGALDVWLWRLYLCTCYPVFFFKAWVGGGYGDGGVV